MTVSHSSTQAENNNNAIIKLSDLDLIIQIKWADSEEWIVRFLKVSEKNKFTTAPRVYTLNRVAKNQLAKSQRA